MNKKGLKLVIEGIIIIGLVLGETIFWHKYTSPTKVEDNTKI